MLDSSPGRTMSAVPISFGAVIVLMLSVSQASSAVVPSQAQVQPSTANQSTVANSDDSDLSARFKELQLEYNKTLLNDNLVTEIDKCNSLSAFKEESKVKILCSVYFDMLDGLSAANVSFGGPDKVTEAIRKYSNIESSKTFCDSFKAELLIKEDRRAFSQRTFAANKHLLEALQSSDKCALLCTVMDKDANISVKPFCSVSVEGFRLIKAAEKDVALTKPQNATNNRTAVSQSADLASQKDTSASDVKTAAPLSVPSITANKKTSESSTKGNGVEQNGKPPVLPIKDGIVKATTIPDSKLRQDELEGELEGEEVEDENPETGAGNRKYPFALALNGSQIDSTYKSSCSSQKILRQISHSQNQSTSSRT